MDYTYSNYQQNPLPDTRLRLDAGIFFIIWVAAKLNGLGTGSLQNSPLKVLRYFIKDQNEILSCGTI
ncbi:hypothetical protein QE152_g5652 [Popillia japonica]|uniref:Uncharacterized protein n=1 Tax=Popillia japonica TaxID=7064 RepID=A0AAW1MHS4_POPJA